MKLTMQFFFKSETYDESVFAWFLGRQVLNCTVISRSTIVCFIEGFGDVLAVVILLFCAPEPKSQVHYCNPALSVVRPVLCRPSVVRPSSIKLVFFGPIRKTRWPPWLCLAEKMLVSSLKLLNGSQWNLKEGKISRSSFKFVFFRPIITTRRPPWPLIDWDIFDFSSETA